MAQKQEMKITIGKDGAVNIEVVCPPIGCGEKVADCMEVSRFLEEALGIVKDRDMKPEFYARQAALGNQTVGS